MGTYSFLLGLIGVVRAFSKETLDFALIIKNAVQFYLQVTDNKQGINEFTKRAKKFDKQFSFENSLFCIHNGAMSAIQHCPEIKFYYNRKI